MILQNVDLSENVNLQTNGEYLTTKTSAAILKAGLSSITIGFDGASKEVYESHRVGCHYDIVLGNIVQFVRIRASLRKSTALAIKFVRTKQNAHEVADAYKLFAGILNPWIDLFYDTISENWGNPALQNVAFAGTQSDMPPKYCGYPDNNLVILADGSVSACCFDYNLSIAGGPIGNVRRQTILDVWRGTSFENLRRSLRRPGRDGKPARCLACGLSFPRPTRFYEEGPAIEAHFVQSQENGFNYYFTKHLKIRPFVQLALGARSRGTSWALRRGASLARSVLKRRFGIG
jgi:MoaA/NifB/PqqE/SkfB family radical SAM enzyme